MLRRASVLLAILSLCALPACRPPRPVGTSLGQYEVHGDLMESTCGQGYPATDLWFFVELRHEPGGIGYWKPPMGSMIQGMLEPQVDFHFSDQRQIVAIEPDEINGVIGCALTREETVDGEFGGEAPDAGVALGDGHFDAADIIRVRPASGDCSALFVVNGGPFDALPCQLDYAMIGERVED
ncbi:MAG: hypothetical protein AB7S26_15295 [Sandaracinaceae bacterium]